MVVRGSVGVEALKELDAFNQHELDRIMEFFSDDATFDMPRGPHPWGTRYVGKDEVRKGLATQFAGIPDVHYGEDRHWVNGDRGISEWLLTGTSTTGQKISVRGCDLFQFRDGKVSRKDSCWKIVEQGTGRNPFKLSRDAEPEWSPRSPARAHC